MDDVDPFDIDRAPEGPTESHSELNTLHTLLALDGLMMAEQAAVFCTTAISRQFAVRNGAFSEDKDGALKPKHLPIPAPSKSSYRKPYA